MCDLRNAVTSPHRRLPPRLDTTVQLPTAHLLHVRPQTRTLGSVCVWFCCACKRGLMDRADSPRPLWWLAGATRATSFRRHGPALSIFGMAPRSCGDHFCPPEFRQSATWWKECGSPVEGPEGFFRICSARRKDGGKKVNVHCEVNVRDLVPAPRPPRFPLLVWHRDCAEITFDRLGSAKVPPGGTNAEARSRGLKTFSGFVPLGGKMAERRQMYITR